MLRTAVFFALALATAPAWGLGSEFTYQGTLEDTGAPANGSYDLQFTLQDSRDNTIGSPLLLDDVAVVDGVFTVQLDFGSTAFTGATRKLRIGVRPGVSTGAFTLLTPANPVSPTPHALVAGNALIATTVTDGAIGTAQVADNAITSIKIATGSITDSDIAGNTITGASIADGTVNSADLANNAIIATKITDGAVGTSKISDGAITSAKLADGAITSAKIVNGTITDADIAGNTITGQSIANATITGTNIANATITGQNIASGTIGTSNLALDAVTTSRIADGAVNDVDIAFRTITSQRISPNTITAGEVATNAFWNGTGNAGTNPAVNFLGTNDGKPLQIKAGRVGINTAAPEATLDIHGPDLDVAKFSRSDDPNRAARISQFELAFDSPADTGKLTHTENSSNEGPDLRMTMTTGKAELTLRYNAPNDTAYLFLDDNLASGSARAYKPGGGPWESYSDMRLKHDVEPLSGALDHLLQLRSVRFQYIEKAGERRLPRGVQTGFVAQEVQQVFPDWVNPGPDGFLMVGPKGFEALTVQALRELRAEKDDAITVLEAKNAALRSQLDAVLARLAKLEAEH